MRNSFILLTLFLITASLKAQNVYTYKAYAETYKNLVKTISLNNSQTEDVEETGPYDVPFSFKIAGQTITHFDFEDNNFVFFTGLSRGTGTKYYLTAISDIGIQDTQAGVSEQEALNKEASENTSDLEYSYYIVSVEGIAGSRILKLEVKNSGSESEFDLNETDNLFVNFQIWIYETTNMIEYREGGLSNTVEGVKIFRERYYMIPVGIAYHIQNYLCYAYNNPLLPARTEFMGVRDKEKTINIKSSYSLSSNVYQFIPAESAEEEELEVTEFAMHTDPVLDILYITLGRPDTTIEFFIIDRAGIAVMEGTFKTVENKLMLTGLEPGMYFMKTRAVIHDFINKK